MASQGNFSQFAFKEIGLAQDSRLKIVFKFLCFVVYEDLGISK